MSAQIVVAEDSALNRKLVASMLEKLGYQSIPAADGSEAVRMVATGGCVAVFMDCLMPVMDGFEAARAIRLAEAPGQRLPIIALTGADTLEERQRCIDAGMDDFLAKPVDLGAIRATLEKWAPCVG
jgi:CheY-like chemotaxis protein